MKWYFYSGYQLALIISYTIEPISSRWYNPYMSTKKKDKKKITLGNIIMVLMFMILGGVCGVAIANFEESSGEGILSDMPPFVFFACMIVVLYLVMFLQIIIHEGGHLVFGLLSGYKFVSFRIMSFMWIKKGDHIEFKRYSLAGTGGQCLMAPPDLVDGKMPTLIYNLGGSLMNIIAAAVGYVAYRATLGTLVSQILLYFVLVGVGFALVNGIPLKLGTVNNDGYNALMLRRDPAATRAFWIMLKTSELNSNEVRLCDMPEEWFELPTEEQMDNSLTSSIAVFRANRMVDQHRFEEANALMKSLLSGKNGIMGIYRCIMVNDRFFLELLNGNAEEAKRLLNKGQRKFMKQMKQLPGIIRTEYAIAKLLDCDASAAGKVLERFERVAGTHPYECEIESERELIKLIDQVEI